MHWRWSVSKGLYQAVSVEEMQAGTPVQFVGVHPLLWHDHPEQPTMGFVEYDADPEYTRDAALGRAVRVSDWTLPWLTERKHKLLKWKYAHRDVWTVEMQVALVCLSRYIAALDREHPGRPESSEEARDG